MRRRWALCFGCGIVLSFWVVTPLANSPFSPTAVAFQGPGPTVIVGSPQSTDDWPIGTSQLIRWALKDIPQSQMAKQSDIRVQIDLVGEAGSQDLRKDDGEADLELDQGDTIMVARFRPPSYPATLEQIQVFAPTVEGQSDRQRDITLYFFADQEGREQPPDLVEFQTAPGILTSTGSFNAIPVPTGPTLNQSPGVFYIGYEITRPTSGFTFPIDQDNERRTFVADTNGITFRNAEFPDQNGAPFQGNLMVRATVNVAATSIPIAENLGNTGEFCWRVGIEGQSVMTGSERRPAQIRVTAELPDSGEVLQGQSEQFTISEPQQSITVTSPSSGDIWRMKEEHIITWDAVGLVGDARVELVSVPSFAGDPVDVICLFDGEDVNIEQRSWEVGAPRPGFYRIKVSSSLDFRISDESDVFVILEEENIAANEAVLAALGSNLEFFSQRANRPVSCTSCGSPHRQLFLSSPSITVVWPNGGEVFEPEDRIRITWGSQGVSGRVRVVLFDLSQDPGNPEQRTIIEVDNTGSFEWRAPFLLSDALKLGVISVDDPSVADVSDGVFTVGNPGQGKIEIIMPNGGEEFEVGTEARLMWTIDGSDVGDKVRIDISFDGGISYQPLCPDPRCTDVDNNGDYRLGINFEPSDNVRLRIVSKRRPRISDVTNCSFRIIPPKPPDPNAPQCPAPRR